MKKHSAFTLIETLIVICVFFIGILTVLFGITRTLRNQNHTNLQIKSAFFAREWMELLFNMRDSNYHKELPRNCIFTRVDENDEKIYDEDENPFCNGYIKPWTVIKIWIWTGNEYIHAETWSLLIWKDENNDEIIDFTGMFKEYQIYAHTWDENNTFIYNHEWTDEEKTGFARYLVITGVVDENWKAVSEDSLLKVESHVLYQRMGQTGEKVMETFIWNYKFADN